MSGPESGTVNKQTSTAAPSTPAPVHVEEAIRAPSKSISREPSHEPGSHPGEITEAAKVIIRTLREQIPELQPTSPLYVRFDDLYLNRFVKARKGHLDDVLVMVKNHIAWYKDFGVANIMEFRFSELELFRKVYPHGYHGVDRLGRPVYIERYSNMDSDYLYGITTLERISKYWVRGYEHLLYDRFPACGPKIMQSCVILDLAGVKLGMFGSRAREFVRTVSKVSSDNYPETLGAMFVVNVPSFFSILYSAVKPLIPPETKKKIHIITAKHVKTELLKYIDAGQLPKFLGGECVCDATSKKDDMGCLSSDKGPWHIEHDDDTDEFVSCHEHDLAESRSFISAIDRFHTPMPITRLASVDESGISSSRKRTGFWVKLFSCGAKRRS